ncbi:hypothetical protein MSAN_01911200 [Mycena sanguinolenta]|uniref:Uncharacterized protein n=1 Tax=Mycena sanguinolenta TaxID=230812 RepID=A0A8H7CRA3_9AGAR|nr:hypothetical protein MSAN_01911200 [Mycena sanguinolenta]
MVFVSGIRLTFFGLLFLFTFQKTCALTFLPINGTYIAGDQVELQWTLDGSEPANGWQLWFDMGGSAIKLANISPLTTATVTHFPGSKGTFRGMSGIAVLASSNEVDAVPLSITATATFSASIIRDSSTLGSSSSSQSSISSSSVASATITTTSTPSPSLLASSSKSAITTGAVLGIILATALVILSIVLGFIVFFVARRRRLAAAQKTKRSHPAEVEELLAQRGPPAIRWSPPRTSLILPPLPPSPFSPSPFPPYEFSSDGTSRESPRRAYLNPSAAQLQPNRQNSTDSESGSDAFSRLHASDVSIPPTPPTSLPPSMHLPHPAEQSQPRIAVARARTSSSGASGAASAASSSGLTAPSAISTVVRSPLQFRHTASDLASPISPEAPPVPPW